MKTKWYLSTLVIVLALLGICHNQITVPNQEILLQFDNDEVTLEQSQNAIATIKQQLKLFGVDHIQVHEESHGRLKISYHSSSDVASIKKTLAGGKNLQVDFAFSDKEGEKLPSEENPKSFNLDIYELQSTNGDDGSAGKGISVVKQDYDRFYNPNVTLHFTQIDASEANSIVKQAIKVNKNIAIAINNTSHIIPEVRAGPSTMGNL